METVICGKKYLFFLLIIFLANMCMAHVLHAEEKYQRPYGPGAPWNIPVKGIPRHSDSDYFASLLWNDSSARPGNFNTGFDGYTYPVYEVTTATDIYSVEISTNWGANMDGKTMPWNPDWIPGKGDDAQIIVLDPENGYEWNFWQVRVDEDNKIVYASNGNLIQRGITAGDGNDPANYWTKENGFQLSRGCGIQYLAMLVRPQEIAAGKIEHAFSMPIMNTDGNYFLPPATRLEHPNNPSGIPEGMRFALDVTDEEIEDWVNSLPSQFSETTRNSARIIGRALRDYGWFITDTSGGAGIQFESRNTAGAAWDALGLGYQTAGYKEYPRDILDGLFTEDRIYALVPSDEYPTIDNEAPSAIIDVSPDKGTEPLTVSYDGSDSYDSDGTIVSYEWNFGDGSQSERQSGTHTYTQEGTYTVSLTVTDNDDAKSTASATVVVEEVVANVYIIRAKAARRGGTISPKGNVEVEEGENQTFNIAASRRYVIRDVRVDGKSVGRVTSYTFRNVSNNHDITAYFKRRW